MKQNPKENGEYALGIDVDAHYLDEQSEPDRDRYVFAYTIHIRNTGAVPARLLGRHWVITDANGKVEEVVGDGVVGEQPWLRPGDDFTYTSGAVLETHQGTMHGSYAMLADDGTRFEAPIPAFVLAVPRTLH
ncbi:MAG: Co2+/Mg2+ efflux protein ApaG [Luteimonas sp.]